MINSHYELKDDDLELLLPKIVEPSHKEMKQIKMKNFVMSGNTYPSPLIYVTAQWSHTYPVLTYGTPFKLCT